MNQIIAWPVKPIKNINELSAADGTRQLDFPYFIDGPHGWEIHVISDRTDPQALMKLIEQEKVYIYYDINKQ